MLLNNMLNSVNAIPQYNCTGYVKSAIGVLIEVVCPNLFIDEVCHIYYNNSTRYVRAQVVGFKKEVALVMPFESSSEIAFGCLVKPTGNKLQVNVSEQLIGRVVDAFCTPIDNLGELKVENSWPRESTKTNPLHRAKIQKPIETGVAAIDTFLTLGRGQRLGLFAGSGVGKSSLLGTIAKNITSDINVIALIGERGREVADFIEDVLGPDGLKNSVIIVATADEPPLTRIHAVYSAIVIAEYFSAKGKDVMFLMDSITRYAMAMRDVGLAAGEPPTLKGYTSSVFTKLPELIERFGSFKDKGDITAILTVLIEGGDVDDPIVDAVRAIMDGHIMLSRGLAERGHYPAIDVLKSTSRLFNKLNDEDLVVKVNKAKEILATYEDTREFLELGSQEQKSQNAVYQQAIKLNSLLKQSLNTFVPMNQAQEQLKACLVEG